MGAFAERHEGAVPVFVRGSDALIRASFFFIGENCVSTQRCFMLSLCKIGHEAVATEPSVFTVEMYTPGEIVEARRPFSAETATEALRAAMGWIIDGGHDATRVRIVDTVGTIMFDQPVAKLQ